METKVLEDDNKQLLSQVKLSTTVCYHGENYHRSVFQFPLSLNVSHSHFLEPKLLSMFSILTFSNLNSLVGEAEKAVVTRVSFSKYKQRMREM
jgi:hypothetical protein